MFLEVFLYLKFFQFLTILNMLKLYSSFIPLQHMGKVIGRKSATTSCVRFSLLSFSDKGVVLERCR